MKTRGQRSLWRNDLYDKNEREKERDVIQSYDEIAYTNRKFNNKLTTQKRH